MGMKFDRRAPGQGVRANCRLESGRAYLDWEFFLAEAAEAEQKGILSLYLRDRQGAPVLQCLGGSGEEEPMKSVLLQPRLWNGMADPYLYTLEAILLDEEGVCRDRLVRQLALYSLTWQGDLFLNGARFDERAVRYSLPKAESPAQLQRAVTEDLQRLREMGANCLYMEEGDGTQTGNTFSGLFERLGFLVRPTGGGSVCQSDGIAGVGREAKTAGSVCREGEAACPVCRGEGGALPVYRGAENSLVGQSGIPTAEFYRYKAKWSAEPFVYIAPGSVRRQENGSFSAVIYSNSTRVALYSDGILHEFQSGCCEFVFRGIPAKKPCVLLAAETENCRSALTIHKSLLK